MENNRSTPENMSQHSSEAKGPFTEMSERALHSMDEGLTKVKTQSEKMLESKKEAAVHYLEDYAVAVKDAAVSLQELNHGEITPYLQTASDRLGEFASFLQTKPVREMANDAVNLARRNPGLFVASSCIAGLLIARFAKASAQADQGFSSQQISGVSSQQTSGVSNAPQQTSKQYRSEADNIYGTLENSTQRHFEPGI